MKKGLTVIVVLVVLTSMLGGALAAENYDQEIVFHGIPWDINMPTLIDSLAERGIVANSDDVASDRGVDVWTYDFHNDWKHAVGDGGLELLISYLRADKESPTIAGYDINTCTFACHYDVSNGIASLDESKTHYYIAKLWLDVENELVPAAFDDLSNKLKTLYGDEAVSKTFTDSVYTYTMSVWEGANNTGVCVYRSESSDNEYQHITLMYGKTNSEETLAEVRKAVLEGMPPADANDVSGL